MAAPDDEFFAALERNFTGIRCSMEAQRTVSNSTQCGLFIGEYKKYTVCGVTFSFENGSAHLQSHIIRVVFHQLLGIQECVAWILSLKSNKPDHFSP